MVRVLNEDNEEYTITREGDMWLATNTTLNIEEYIGPLLFILECIL